MPSLFERFFGRRPAQTTPKLPAGGLVEVFRPALPAPVTDDMFELLAPPEPVPTGGALSPVELVPPEALARHLRPRQEEPQFELIEAPAPAERPRNLTEAFFPTGHARRAEEKPEAEGPGLFELFTELQDPLDRERGRRGIVPKQYLERLMDLGEIQGMVTRGRRDKDFRAEVEASLHGGAPAELPLLLIAPEEKGAEDKVADFLGIPRTEIEKLERAGKSPWRELLGPALYTIERGLDWHLGDKVPGTFHFGVNDQNEFGLFYIEEHPDL